MIRRPPRSTLFPYTNALPIYYRKFAWWNTQFSFAGVRNPGQPAPEVTPDYDDGRWVFTGPTDKVFGKVKQIPVLPIVTLAEGDRKSTRLNSSHGYISYAVFCLKKKKKKQRE